MTLGSGLYFFSLELLRNYLKSQDIKNTKKIDKRTKDFISGGIAKSLAVFMVNPVTTIKTQFESSRKKLRMIDVINKINKNGPKNFYSGFWATFLRDVPYSAIQFTIYNHMYDALALSEKKNNISLVSLIGGVSSMISLFLTHPFDVLRVNSNLI